LFGCVPVVCIDCSIKIKVVGVVEEVVVDEVSTTLTGIPKIYSILGVVVNSGVVYKIGVGVGETDSILAV